MRRFRDIHLSTLMPFIILFMIVLLFTILSKGLMLKPSNLLSVFRQSFPTMLAGLGMVFVATLGGTDITHGSLAGLAATLGAIGTSLLGYGAFIPVAILTGIASGLLMGFINVKLKVSSFMASLALLIAYRALDSLLLEADVYFFPSELDFILDIYFDIVFCLIMIALISYLFHFTPYGYYVRGIGENENAMIYAGIAVRKIKIFAFVLSGTMASIAGVFLAARVGGVNNVIGQGFEMKVMMAMFIAGIPVEGGMRSNILKVVVGAPTIIFLENGLALCNVDSYNTQLVRGIVLLLAIFLSKRLSNIQQASKKRMP